MNANINDQQALRHFEFTNMVLYPARAKNNSKVAAYVSVTISDEIRIYGIKIINGEKGPYVFWPKYRAEDKKVYRPFRFLNQATKDSIDKAILDEFHKGNFTIKTKKYNNDNI